MKTLEQMAPSVEVYSIDEAFLDLSGVRNCMVLENFGREVRETVKRNTHLTVGVGVAQTKTLANWLSMVQKNGSRQAESLTCRMLNVSASLWRWCRLRMSGGYGRRISK